MANRNLLANRNLIVNRNLMSEPQPVPNHNQFMLRFLLPFWRDASWRLSMPSGYDARAGAGAALRTLPSQATKTYLGTVCG